LIWISLREPPKGRIFPLPACLGFTSSAPAQHQKFKGFRKSLPLSFRTA
jgi:hypothetical protein